MEREKCFSAEAESRDQETAGKRGYSFAKDDMASFSALPFSPHHK